jgi:hypothetical protein
LLELRDWIEQMKFPDKPWLVLGKGPTFSRRYEFRLQNYNTMALNHVVREQMVDVAHVIDIEVVEPCADALLYNCNWLIMPRRPHIHCSVSDYMTLEDWIQCMPVLAEAEKRGKLITYTFAHEPVPEDPWTIDARYFSSEIALGILGRMNVKLVRSLGIDGGTNYSKAFEDLSVNTLLVNGQTSFDRQFDRLNELAFRYGIDYQPLTRSVDEDISLAPTDTINFEPPAAQPPPTWTSAASKIQMIEGDLRNLREELANTNHLLYLVTKELSVSSERLGWAQDEIKQYKDRVVELEQTIHSLYKSTTWKIGRVVTKPAQVLGKPFASGDR